MTQNIEQKTFANTMELQWFTKKSTTGKYKNKIQEYTFATIRMLGNLGLVPFSGNMSFYLNCNRFKDFNFSRTGAFKFAEVRSQLLQAFDEELLYAVAFFHLHKNAFVFHATCTGSLRGRGIDRAREAIGRGQEERTNVWNTFIIKCST